MVIQRIIEYLAPAVCLNCGVEGQLLCQNCRSEAIIAKTPTCYACNRLSPGGRTCTNCRRTSNLVGVVIASRYEGAILELVSQLKYHGQQSAGRVCGDLIVQRLNLGDFDVVTAVPAASGRQLQRGYNQAELIGRTVAHALKLPYADLLVRTSEARQVGHGRRERFAQAEQSYLVKSSRLIKNSRVLVIDDVVTTGATLAACARALKAEGAKSIWGAVVAKH